jgi:uncharacterized membrane protein YdjX (TVP38/TMEM64 family)
MSRTKLGLIVFVAALVAAFFFFDLERFLSVAAIKQHQAGLAALYARRPLAVIGIFFAVYAAVTALSLPGAAILTLAAGAIFGLVAGTAVASFASSAGATLAFLSSRYLLREAVQRRFGARLLAVNAGIERDGAFYLFTLRLVPLFPFFIVNLVMGLTSLKTRTFYLVGPPGILSVARALPPGGAQGSGRRASAPQGVMARRPDGQSPVPLDLGVVAPVSEVRAPGPRERAA